MKPFVQTFPTAIRPLMVLLVCAVLSATGVSASTQTVLLRPDCAVIRIMDPAHVPLECKASQNAHQFDANKTTQPQETTPTKVSFSIEATARTLRRFNIADIAKPLPLPNQIDHTPDLVVVALSDPLPGWDTVARSLKCCDGLLLRAPRTAPSIGFNTKQIFVAHTVLGLTLYFLILIHTNMRRPPRGQRRRRRTRVSRPLTRAPFPLRLMPRQRVHESAILLAA